MAERKTITEQYNEQMAKPPKCKPFCGPRDWRDEPAKDGYIRTVCRRCGAFVGYRTVGAKGAG